ASGWDDHGRDDQPRIGPRADSGVTPRGLGGLLRQLGPLGGLPVREWPARAAANPAPRGEKPRHRFARWTARWRGGAPPGPAQGSPGAAQALPSHWRRFPDPWPMTVPAHADAQETLAAPIDELPAIERRYTPVERTLTVRTRKPRGKQEAPAWPQVGAPVTGSGQPR